MPPQQGMMPPQRPAVHPYGNTAPPPYTPYPTQAPGYPQVDDKDDNLPFASV